MKLLGVDVGSTKTHALLVDENGAILGFGSAGPGNHETVGLNGFADAVQQAVRACMKDGTDPQEIDAAVVGISGFDWPSQEIAFMSELRGLGLHGPLKIFNDACLGIPAGSDRGWGVALVSGTGCNCWGWTEGQARIAHVTGAGDMLGEGAGATDLIAQAVRQVAYEWTGRGPKTLLSESFMAVSQASSLSDLVESLATGRMTIQPSAAPLVFAAAEAGDRVAKQVITWAAEELGELAACVIRQLELMDADFDLVLTGSMFDGGEHLLAPLREKVMRIAPYAKMIRLRVPPVVGAVILAGIETGKTLNTAFRSELLRNMNNGKVL